MTYSAESVPPLSSIAPTPVHVHQYPPSPKSATHSQDKSTGTPPLPPFSEIRPGDDEDKDAVISVREIMRTPSPTPTEARALEQKTQTFNWKRIGQLLHWRRFTNKRGAWTLIAGIAIITFFIVFVSYQQKIANALLPFSDWLRNTPGAWVIPIAIMFVLSFPPLFGHEIVGILCGDVWGVWLGFAIFGAGTVLGELGNFYAFNWFCMTRGKAFEEKQLRYALYAQVVREGGLRVPVIMRFSAIPGHFLTAIFSTCGMNVFIFLTSAILSLPKQLAVVYIGVGQSGSGTSNSKTTKGVKAGVIIATIVITLIAMRYINARVDEVKHRVVYKRRKARQAKALAAASKEDADEPPSAYAFASPSASASASASAIALSSGADLEGAAGPTPAKRHFFHGPHPSAGNGAVHDHTPSDSDSPRPLRTSVSEPSFPAHPSKVRTAAGMHGADVDMEMGMVTLGSRGQDTSPGVVRASHPGCDLGVGGARPPEMRSLSTHPFRASYDAAAGGRVVGGGAQG